MGFSDGNSTRVTFDAANEKELIFPAGEQTEAILIKAHRNNNDIIYIMLDDETDQPNAIPLEAGDTFTLDINTAANPMYAEALDTADELRAAWVK